MNKKLYTFPRKFQPIDAGLHDRFGEEAYKKFFKGGSTILIFILIFCMAFSGFAQAKKKKKATAATPTATATVQTDTAASTMTPQAQPPAPAGVVQGKTAAYYYEEGLRFEKNMDYKNAYANFYMAVNMDKTYYNAYRKLGNIYFTAKNYKYAIYFYEKYLVYKPNDKPLRDFVAGLKAKLAAAKPKPAVTPALPLIPEQQGPMANEFKSPTTALMMADFDLISFPLVSGWGSFYARTRGQDYYPGQASVSIASDIIMAFSAGTYLLLEGSKAKDLSAFNHVANLCAVLTSSSMIFDFASSPFEATENAEKFINYIKTRNVTVPKDPVQYKDPLLASSLSLVAGNVVPGIGHFYCGDNETGLKLLLITYGMNSVLTGAGFFVMGQQHLAGEIIFAMDALVYSIMRFVDIQGSAAETDGINEVYYEQKLCPNSPLKQIEIKDEKSPALAFGIAAVPGFVVHGLGNLYAENYITAMLLAGWELTGGVMYMAANGPDGSKLMNMGSGFYLPANSQGWVKYAGLGIFGMSYIYDMATAPGYTAIYNAVYTNKTGNIITPNKAAILPYIDKNGAGLELAYNF